MLGRGGMAEAFLCHRRDDPSRHPMVLKRIRPDLAKNDEYHRRFVLEAQVASRFDHPNLVRFREFGRVGQCHYIAMDQVRGFSLKRLLDATYGTSPPPVEGAIFIGAGILDGLAAMHSLSDDGGRPRPMLHRDVTPTNIIVTHDGHPVIIDFGITKDILGPQITLPGRVIGTMRYMAPEHRKAEFIDARADVFSASVIVYELLAGRQPWTQLDGMRELLRVTFDPPEIPPEVRARVPEEIWTVVLKGLACDPNDRHADARAMARELEETPTYRAIASVGAASVRTWLAERALAADEDLGEPVVDRPLQEGLAQLDLIWNEAGALTTGEEKAVDPAEAEVLDASVLTIPPLPPTRAAALEGTTGDLDPAVVPGKPGWVLPLIVILAMLGGLIVLLTRS